MKFLALRLFAIVLASALFGFAMAFADIDRHPELKSRAVAWTEFDGSYLVDTTSRADMLDFYWNVFAKPYPAAGWTGTLNPPVAGTMSEARRIREYAQLNAYRALNYTAPASPVADFESKCMDAALVICQNPDKINTGANLHLITSDWIGYTPEAAETAGTSLIGGAVDDLATQTGTINGFIDNFISDEALANVDLVGHRMSTLHDNSVTVGVGEALQPGTTNAYVAVWHQPYVANFAYGDYRFIAYPAPGYMPIPLFKRDGIRWSFAMADDGASFLVGSYAKSYIVPAPLTPLDASVTAKINGVPVPVHHVALNNSGAPITWDFDPSVLDFNSVADGTTVEITVSNVAEIDPEDGHTVIGYHNYTYTVTLFDPNKIVPVSYAPQTPLINISTRGVIGSSEKQMIAGFSVSGTSPVRVALRTQGPGLTQYGVQNAAKSTHLRVYDSTNTLLGENAGWKQSPDWRLLQSLGLSPSNYNEAGIVLTLWPGTYTAVVSDDTGSGGVGIVEGFNIDNLTTDSQLVNVSTRGVVGVNEKQMIGGFTISGSARTVVIRTQGPTLAKYGVSNPVADTVLSIVAQSDKHTVAENDDWRTDTRNARLATDLATYAPGNDREAALVLTLEPGSYTALVSSKGAEGVGIVEVFDVAP